MASLEFLNTAAHDALRVRPATAENRHFAQIVPSEFGAIATRCPILMTKNAETGQFYAGALFGFSAGENLLIDADGRFDGTMPFDLEREGFFIVDDAIAIDRAHARFADGEGAALFDEDGEPSGALRRVQRAIASLKSGLDESDAFITQLLALKLVEPIDIALSFDDGERLTLEGLYTVSRDALGDLPDDALVQLFRSGQLQLAFTMIDSLRQIPLLARRRNERLVGR